MIQIWLKEGDHYRYHNRGRLKGFKLFKYYRDWLIENKIKYLFVPQMQCVGGYQPIWFYNDSDAVLFKLTWL